MDKKTVRDIEIKGKKLKLDEVLKDLNNVAEEDLIQLFKDIAEAKLAE